MYASEIRARLHNRQLASLLVPASALPEDLADLKGQLMLVELPGTETSAAAKLAKGSDGEVDELLANATMICKSLVTADTKERIYNDNDNEMVAGYGLTVIKPLSELVQAVCGMNPEALAAAKKNLATTQESGSSTSSPANLEVTPATN